MVAKTQQSLRQFKLWESYHQDEQALFFGRSQEIKTLYDKTFASNLLLLYGAGGAGKTSLIRCGLGNRFEESDWYPIFIRKGDNIIKSISTALRKESDEPEKFHNNSIREKIHQLFLEKFRPVYLIFDQLEELFILGSRQEQDQFFRLIMELLEVNFQCKIILSIKESYLADLDRYEEAIPALFNNRMRVERMRREQLEEVIRGMARKLNIRIGAPEDGPQEQEQVIDEIIEKVKEKDTQRIDLGELQVFMDELFLNDEQRRAREKAPERLICFSRPLIAQTEGIEAVIARRLQEQLEALDQQFRQSISIKRFPYLVLQDLVTDVETKRCRTVGEIANHLLQQYKLAPEDTQACIEALLEGNILNELSLNHRRQDRQADGLQADDKVEIIHDNLAKKLHPLLFNEELHLLKIKAAIVNQYDYYQETGVLLDQKGMEFLAPYLPEIAPGLEEAQHQFIANSQREIKRRALKGTFTLLGIIAFLALSTTIALVQWTRSSRLSEANQAGAEALDAFSYDRTLALRRAEEVLQKDPDNTLARNLLTDALLHSWEFPFYQEVLEIGGVEVDRISDLDVSKYNRYLLAGSLDGGLYLQDLSASSQAPLTVLKNAHRQEITDVDFVGKYPGAGFHFLTASRDSTAKLWTIATDTLAEPLFEYHHGEPLSAVYLAFSKKDTLVITAGDRRILLWDYRHPEVVKDSFPALQTTAFEWIANEHGHFLIAAGRDSLLRIFNIDNARDTFSFAIADGAVSAMDFTHGKLAAGLDNGRLAVWEINNSFFSASPSRKTALLRSSAVSGKAHSEAIKDLNFLKNGEQILTSSADKSAKLWDADIHLLKTFLGHNDGVQTITTSKDERFIYSGGEDKTIKKWDLELAAYTPNTIPGLKGKARSVDFIPKENRLLIGTNGQRLALYEKDNWEHYSLLQEIPTEHAASFSDIAVSGDGQFILAARADAPEAELLHINGDKLNSLKHCDKGGVAGVAFSRKEAYFLTSGGKTACVWNKSDTTALLALNYEHPVDRSIATEDENGRPAVLTTVQSDNRAYLWAEGRMDTISHTDEVLSIAFSPDGRYFLTGSQDNSFVIGQVDGEKKPIRIRRHDADVRSVAFAPGKRGPLRFLTADEDGIVRIWAFDGKDCREQKSIIRHGAAVAEAFFLSDTRILTLGTDGKIKIWDTGQMESLVKDNIYRLRGSERPSLGRCLLRFLPLLL